MTRFSASKAGLLAACQFPFRESTPWEETRGIAAVHGDEFHRRIAAVVDLSVAPVDKPVTTKWMRERLAHAETWLAKNRLPGWRSEEAYAYHHETGECRPLGYNIDRKYAEAGLKSDEVGGSADIACVDGTCAWALDWKTGRFITEAAWAQMEVIALMASRAHGTGSARATILHVTDRGVEATTREYSDAQLWMIAEALREDLAAVEDAWPTVGNHCTASFCPARAGCVAYQHEKDSA